MSTRQHIPNLWPSEQQEILRRLQQPHLSTPPLMATTGLLYPCHLVRPDDEAFLEQSRRFRAEKNGTYMHVECINAIIRRRSETRKSNSGETRPYVCIVCQTSNKTIWRIPDEPLDPQFDCIAVTWYELPP